MKMDFIAQQADTLARRQLPLLTQLGVAETDLAFLSRLPLSLIEFPDHPAQVYAPGVSRLLRNWEQWTTSRLVDDQTKLLATWDTSACSYLGAWAWLMQDTQGLFLIVSDKEPSANSEKVTYRKIRKGQRSNESGHGYSETMQMIHSQTLQDIASKQRTISELQALGQ